MKRELSTREKVMLLVLTVIVIALGYFKLIYEPINDQIADYQSRMEQEQTENASLAVRLAQMRKMEKAVEEIKASGEVKAIPGYDNSGRLMRELVDRRVLSMEGTRGSAVYVLEQPSAAETIEVVPAPDPERTILAALARGPLTRSELIRATGISESVVRYRLRILRQRELVELVGKERSPIAVWRAR